MPASNTLDLDRANLNGALWALGNALIGTALVVHLVETLGGSGTMVAWVLAAPQLVGALRVVAPAIEAAIRPRRRWVIGLQLAAFALVATLPLAALAARDESPGKSIALGSVAVIWGLWHLLLYVSVVGLWSWLRSLLPGEAAGFHIGRRERWLAGGALLGAVLSFALSGALAPKPMESTTIPRPKSLTAHVVGCELGALLMAISLLPLVRMSDPTDRAPVRLEQPPADRLFDVLAKPEVRQLMAFNAAFSLTNGLTATAANLYPYRVWGLTLATVLAAQSLMRVGQFALDPWWGRLCDRQGAGRTMAISQLLAALGLAFLPLGVGVERSSVAAVFCLFLAHLAWIGYGGLNAGLPLAMLRSAFPGKTAAAVAWIQAVSGVAFAIGSLTSGAALDLATTRFGKSSIPTIFAIVATIGVVLRLALVPWAATIEPSPKDKS